MSLIHWWPLNGDLQDKIQGKILQTTSTAFSSGKTGQCLQLQSCESKIPNPFIGLDDWSLCFWMRDDGGAIWSDFVCFSDNLNRLEIHVSSNIWYWYSSSTTSGNFLPTGTSIKTDRVVGRWYHIAMVKSKNNAWLYIDGELVSSGTTASNFTSASSYLHFNSRASSSTSGKTSYNDIRAYDHALSQAEVKELSKALVVHYTFDDVCAEPTTNLLPASLQNKYVENVADAASYTVTSGLTASAYTLSANIKRHIGDQSPSPYFSLNVTYSDGTTDSLSTYTAVDGYNIRGTADGQFHHYRLTVLNPNKKSVTKVHGWILDRGGYTAGTPRYMTVQNAQLEAKDHVTPYTPSTRDGMIYNETGLNQPTILKNIGLTTDSCVGSLAFQSNSSYIVQDSIGDGEHGALASMWIKMPLTSNWIAFVDSSSKLGFGCYSGYGVIASTNRTNKRRVSNLGSLWNASGWNHVVVTMNSSNTVNRCWINGVEGSYGDPDHWTHNNNSLVIGSRYSSAYGEYPSTVKIDDFRLYYTCPSDGEIVKVVQDLYKTKAMITDKSDIMCGEFVENKNEAGVTEKSTFDCKEVFEQLDVGSDYECAEYIEFSETQYIDTGLAFTDATVPIIIEADIVKIAISGNDCLAGCGVGSSWQGPVMLNCHNYTLEFGVNGYATASDGSGSIALNERMSIRAEIYTNGNDHRWYKNGNRINLGSSAYKDRTSSNSTLYIGAFHNGTSNSIASGSCWIGRLYSFKVWYGDSCRILIPAKRKSDNAFGLYDMAGHSFYPNIGGGSLSGRPVLTKAAIYQDGRVSGREIIEI